MKGLACAGCSAGLVGPGGAASGIPPEMDIVMMDRIDIASRAGAGQLVTVRMNGLTLRDRPGRYPMVAGFVISGLMEVDTDATLMPAAYPGYNLLGVLNQFRLKDVAGWSYLDGIDGRSLRDERAVALGNLGIHADPQDLADATTANVQRGLTWVCRLAHFWDRGMPISADGCIPLGALIARSDALQFNVVGSGGLPAHAGGSNAGITPSGVSGSWFQSTATSPFVYVWALILWVDHPHVSAPWQLENYVDANLNGQLRHCERLNIQSQILHFPEDTVGNNNVDDYSQIQCEVGGVVRKGGVILQESVTQDQLHYMLNLDFTTAAPIFTPLSGTHRTILLVPPQKNLKGAAHGGVVYAFARGTHLTTRFLCRTVAELTDLHEAAILAAMGAPSGVQAYSAASNPGKTLPSERMKQFIARRYL